MNSVHELIDSVQHCRNPQDVSDLCMMPVFALNELTRFITLASFYTPLQT